MRLFEVTLQLSKKVLQIYETTQPDRYRRKSTCPAFFRHIAQTIELNSPDLSLRCVPRGKYARCVG